MAAAVPIQRLRTATTISINNSQVGITWINGERYVDNTEYEAHGTRLRIASIAGRDLANMPTQIPTKSAITKTLK